MTLPRRLLIEVQKVKRLHSTPHFSIIDAEHLALKTIVMSRFFPFRLKVKSSSNVLLSLFVPHVVAEAGVLRSHFQSGM